ncbi:hypothetical protein OAB57_00980 [Bacteriovoracaceae bacterium]|nr:hypothetical protein [Bacteriovoracaceae bacterium]
MKKIVKCSIMLSMISISSNIFCSDDITTQGPHVSNLFAMPPIETQKTAIWTTDTKGDRVFGLSPLKPLKRQVGGSWPIDVNSKDLPTYLRKLKERRKKDQEYFEIIAAREEATTRLYNRLQESIEKKLPKVDVSPEREQTSDFRTDSFMNLSKLNFYQIIALEFIGYSEIIFKEIRAPNLTFASFINFCEQQFISQGSYSSRNDSSLSYRLTFGNFQILNKISTAVKASNSTNHCEEDMSSSQIQRIPFISLIKRINKMKQTDDRDTDYEDFEKLMSDRTLAYIGYLLYNTYAAINR